MRNTFCGWYFRCQSDRQTLAVIPSFHRIGKTRFCAIQLITDRQSFFVQLPCSDLKKQKDHFSIAGNQFGDDGIILDIQTPSLRAVGSLRFGPFTTIKYDIMGPFQYVPFMQCRHSVYSMRHSVHGEILVNGTPYSFRNAVGYVEGDRGCSFPEKYVWTQCSFSRGSLMLSIAEIPMGIFHFTGMIGIILLDGEEYRLATYLGAKAEKISAEEIIVRQGPFVLSIRSQSRYGHPLCAPIGGALARTIHEHPSCRVLYRFEKNRIPLLQLDAPSAAFEYEY